MYARTLGGPSGRGGGVARGVGCVLWRVWVWLIARRWHTVERRKKVTRAGRRRVQADVRQMRINQA